MQKRYIPDQGLVEDEAGFEVGEFGFFSTDTKDSCKRKPKKASSKRRKSSQRKTDATPTDTP